MGENTRSDVSRWSGRHILLRFALFASLFLCAINFRTINLDQFFPNDDVEFGFSPSILLNSSFSAASNGTVSSDHRHHHHNDDDVKLLQSTSAVVVVTSDENKANHTDVMDALHISKETLAAKLPQWTLDYFDWHANQVRLINETNWHDFQLLIARCTQIDQNCGGLSDRLRPLPFLLRLAYDTNRTLMIRWDRPCRLEEFLVPTMHVNWTVPQYMMSFLNRKKGKGAYHFLMKQKTSIQFAKKKKYKIIETRLQLDDGGEKAYLELVGGNTEETYENIYHAMFRALFQPSPELSKVLQYQFDRFGLIPGQYTAAHLRAFYKVEKDTVTLEEQRDQAINAVNCASKLHPGDPIYIASDSAYAMSAAVQYGQTHGRRISANINNNGTMLDPLHLDFASKGNVTYPPSSFFDTFLDILLLGNARCMSTGKGGYADYASVISFNPKCHNSHRWSKCQWRDPN